MTLTVAELVSTGTDDDEQREKFGVREDVLNSRGPFHVPAVYEGQDTYKQSEELHRWKERKKKACALTHSSIIDAVYEIFFFITITLIFMMKNATLSARTSAV